MKLRKVKQIIEPQLVIEGAGVLLRRSFGPTRQNPYDPFLLFDHFAFNDPIDGPLAGFPTHPHRGIETVTYMLEGNVHHRDSLGNIGIIGPGDVQWMTSGRGIMHEEMPKRSSSGRVNGFQLWVNLPSAEKMSRPHYQEILKDTIPSIIKDSYQTRVIAGKLDGKSGPVTEVTAKPSYLDVNLQPKAVFTLRVPAEHSALAYLFEGKGIFGDDDSDQIEMINAVKMIVFGGGEELRIQATPDSHARFILITGNPFNEQIFPYGPFVMNTREEIQQALTDLREGTFVKE